MRQEPDTEALLEAVAAFLEGDVRPAVGDPSLGFRLLIAANTLRTAAAEARHGEELAHAELARLTALARDLGLEGVAPVGATRAEVQAALRRGDEALARGLRAGRWDAADRARIRAHLLDGLREALAATQPRHDLAPRLPGDLDPGEVPR